MNRSIKHMVPVILIMGVTIVISLFLYYKVVTNEEERCWQLLEDAAQSVEREIAMKLEDELVELRLMANMLAQREDLTTDNVEILYREAIQETAFFTRIDILYPDNMVLLGDGTKVPLWTEERFEDIVQKGKNMSERITDPVNGRECIYYSIPILREEEPLAVLVGVIDAGNLSKVFQPTIYNGRANSCIVDRSDGNFIMDNWHEDLGNAYAMKERERVKGYEDVDLKQVIKDGETGVIAFISNTNGRNLYMYYMPISGMDWELMIFVQEELVFENLLSLKQPLLYAGVLEALLLLTYFSWNLYTLKTLNASKKETEHQLENSNTLIQCVTELSSDREIHSSIKQLLTIINQYFMADRTYILETDSSQEMLKKTNEYVENKLAIPKTEALNAWSLQLTEWMHAYQEKQKSIDSLEKVSEAAEDISIKQQKDSQKMAVPLCKDRAVIGFLCIDTPRKHYDDTALLSSVRFFITSALTRQKHQEELTYMSYQDMLTSLYNRNKYMQVLDSSRGMRIENVGVAYIDLNGLKQINDLQSHGAGDNFIRNAAHMISEVFPGMAYRIGGDEFVVLEFSVEKAEFERKIAQVRANMIEEQLSISMGYLWSEASERLEEMLKKAEVMMYQEKEIYYQTHDRRSERR